MILLFLCVAPEDCRRVCTSGHLMSEVSRWIGAGKLPLSDSSCEQGKSVIQSIYKIKFRIISYYKIKFL